MVTIIIGHGIKLKGMTLKNKVFANGRIHGSANPNDTYETGYVAYTASPFDIKFYKEIEEGVQYHVQEFIHKGYLPISSCEGHYYDKQNMNWYIMLAFGGNDIQGRMYSVIKTMQDVPGINFEIREQVNNTNESIGKVVGIQDKKQEVEYMNNLFLKNYDDYRYLYIGLFKNSNWFTRKLLSNYSKNKLLQIIKKDIADERIN